MWAARTILRSGNGADDDLRSARAGQFRGMADEISAVPKDVGFRRARPSCGIGIVILGALFPNRGAAKESAGALQHALVIVIAAFDDGRCDTLTPDNCLEESCHSLGVCSRGIDICPARELEFMQGSVEQCERGTMIGERPIPYPV